MFTSPQCSLRQSIFGIYSKCSFFFFFFSPQIVKIETKCVPGWACVSQIKSLWHVNVFKFNSGITNKKLTNKLQLDHWSQITEKKIKFFFSLSLLKKKLEQCEVTSLEDNYRVQGFEVWVCQQNNSCSCQVKWLSSLKTDTKTSLKHQFPHRKVIKKKKSKKEVQEKVHQSY